MRTTVVWVKGRCRTAVIIFSINFSDVPNQFYFFRVMGELEPIPAARQATNTYMHTLIRGSLVSVLSTTMNFGLRKHTNGEHANLTP